MFNNFTPYMCIYTVLYVYIIIHISSVYLKSADHIFGIEYIRT